MHCSMAHSDFVLFLYAVVSVGAGTSSGCAFFICGDRIMENKTALTEAEQSCLDKCRKMDAESRSLWIRAIEFSPRLASYCPHWHGFTPMEWADLLAHNKDFIRIAPIHEFCGKEWFMVLNRQPSLIEHCPIIEKIPGNYWKSLLEYYPWFENYRKK